ncbi:MAG: hypothetical protein ACLTXL_10170 [Clostridia bacterium]
MTLFDKKVFTGWYRDKACTAGPVTGLKILEELKERPVREAPYAPMDLYAKWETQESRKRRRDIPSLCFGIHQSIKNFNCGKEGYSFRPGCLNRRTGERMA